MQQYIYIFFTELQFMQGNQSIQDIIFGFHMTRDTDMHLLDGGVSWGVLPFSWCASTLFWGVLQLS